MWKKVKKKNNNFPALRSGVKVVIVCLLKKGFPLAMITVTKYSKGWGKSYKSYDEAFKHRPYVELWR